MVAYNFNAQQYQPQYGGSGGFPYGPNGENVDYKVIIVNEEQRPTSKGDGGMLVFVLRSIEGPLSGREMEDRLNLHNPNPKAVEIANKQLSAYCHVTGQFVLQDTAQLRNIPFIITVGKQANSEYSEIKGLKDINGNKPGAGAKAGPATAAPPPQNPPPAQVQPQGGWAPPQGGPPAQEQPQGGGWQAPQGQAPAQQQPAQQQGNWAPPAQQQPAQQQGGWQPPQGGGGPAPQGWGNT